MTAGRALSTLNGVSAPERRELRLPLDTGVVAGTRLAIAAALLIPALAAIAIVVGGFVRGARVEVISVVVPFGVAAVAAFAAVRLIVAALRAGPSDIVFDRKGIRVEGGAHHGLTAEWSAIAPERLILRAGDAPATPAGALMLGLRDGRDVALTSASTFDEQASLAAVIDSLRAGPPLDDVDEDHEKKDDGAWSVFREGARNEKDRLASDATLYAIVRCPSCSTAAIPDDAEVVRCRRCDADVPLHDALRARVREERIENADQRSLERTIDGLLRWRWLRAPWALAAATTLSVPITVVALGSYFYAARRLDAGTSVALGFFGLSAIGAIAFATRIGIERRRWLRTLLAQFAAHAPTMVGNPPVCRCCNAPLDLGVGPAKKRVVRCVYCDAENVCAPFRAHGASFVAPVGVEAGRLKKTLATITDRRVKSAMLGVALLALTAALGRCVSTPPRELKSPTGARIERLTSGLRDEDAPSIDAKGHALLFRRGAHAFSRDQRAAELVVLDPTIPSSSMATVSERGLELTDAAWLPDGSAFLYVAQEPGTERGSVCIATPNGKSRVIAEGTRVEHPSASHDGKRIAFSARAPNGDAYVMLVSIDGGAVQVLWRGRQPSFSPIDARIVFLDAGHVVVGNADAPSSVPTALTSWSGIDSDPSFTPDARSVVFASTHLLGRSTLYAIAAAFPVSSRQLTFGTADCEHPRVGTDGFLYFDADVDGNRDLFRMKMPETIDDSGEAPLALVAAPPPSLDCATSHEPSPCRFECDRGDQRACSEYGAMLQGGKGVEKDAVTAVRLLERACTTGIAGACINAAIGYQDGEGAPKDLAHAMTDFQLACDGGSALGCTYLGYGYEGGRGVRRDVDHAGDLYERACTAGDALGCAGLGSFYRVGRGGRPKDVERALALYDSACGNGDFNACAILGSMFQGGEGTPKDMARAVTLFRKSCDAHDALGCHDLAMLMRVGGWGVEANPAKAVELLAASCDDYDKGACVTLGETYEKGVGVPFDRDKARDAYRRACQAEIGDACAAVKRLEK